MTLPLEKTVTRKLLEQHYPVGSKLLVEYRKESLSQEDGIRTLTAIKEHTIHVDSPLTKLGETPLKYDFDQLVVTPQFLGITMPVGTADELILCYERVAEVKAGE